VDLIWRADLLEDFNKIVDKHPKIAKSNNHVHLGTLGTGNHFVEVCLDLNDEVWIMLHSGSRGVGNRIGSYFIEKAKEDMRKWFINLPDQDLAYLAEGTENFDDYWEAVSWAQKYALINREIMMEHAMRALTNTVRPFEVVDQAVNCHHNYVAIENHYGQNVYVTRKGAIRARKGDLGIIPGSMGARSFIVRGKGNPESLHSCSHGAGRVMSRTEARKRIT
jgi:tRNA-splicing ligase RtcB